MKLTKVFFLLAVLSGSVLAQEPRNYLGAHAGINLGTDWPVKLGFDNNVSANGQVQTGNGSHLGIVLGRQRENSRYELEYQVGQASIDSIQASGIRQAGQGDLKYQALTINAYRVEPIKESWDFYLGAGIGLAKVSAPQQAAIGGCNCFREVSDSGLTYLLRIGVDHHLSKQNRLFLQYTHLFLPKFGGSPGSEYGKNDVGSVNFGFRKLFD